MSQVSSRQAKKLSDYNAPEFTITDVELCFELNPEATVLTAVYQLQSASGKAGTLTLDGQELKLLAVSVDGQLLTADAYQVTPEQLILSAIPAKAQLELKIELNPNSRKIGDWVQEMQRLEMLKEQAETELSRLK